MTRPSLFAPLIEQPWLSIKEGAALVFCVASLAVAMVVYVVAVS